MLLSGQILSAIESDLRAIEEEAALYEEANFNRRADAIDFIDFHIIDGMEASSLKQRAERVKCELEKVDLQLFGQLREKIATGVATKAAFKKMIGNYPGYPVGAASQSNEIGYDNLDIFINGLLSDRAIPEATVEREPEMVSFQKTPARIVFELAERAELSEGDVFFDLGSGLGQVVILMNLISGVVARGVEYEPVYCQYAKACASQLNLSRVEFINTDARRGDYSQGNVFFLYTPFEGRLLQDMLDLLKQEARKRKIRLFTYGPCSLPIARQDWLHAVNGKGDDLYRLYEFRSIL